MVNMEKAQMNAAVVVIKKFIGGCFFCSISLLPDNFVKIIKEIRAIRTLDNSLM